MNGPAVHFCVGCGYVRDEICSGSASAQWIEGSKFVANHAVPWEDLTRVDDVCPSCARVFAIASRRSPLSSSGDEIPFDQATCRTPGL